MKVEIKNIHIADDKLTVYVFNVGQGDHMLIKLPSATYGIIDFYYDERLGLVEPPALSYFKALKESLNDSEFKKIRISFICISHIHKDHIKGINETLEWFLDNNITIDGFWLPGIKEIQFLQNDLLNNVSLIWDKLDKNRKIAFSKTFEDLRGVDNKSGKIHRFYDLIDRFKMQNEKNLNYIQYIKNIRKILGNIIPDIKFFCLGPLDSHLDSISIKTFIEYTKWCIGIKESYSRSGFNILSHILLFRFKENSLLFGGDTSLSVWKDCINTFDENKIYEQFGHLESNFVKVSHHGSKNSSNIKLWERIIDQYCKVHLVISAGRNLVLNHPHKKTLSDINLIDKKHSNINLYSTNICLNKVNKTNLEKEFHDWLELSKSSDDLIYSNVTSILRNNIPKENFSNGVYNLLGYKFEFNGNDRNTTNVKAILSKSIGCYSICYRCNGTKSEIENCQLLIIKS